MKAILLLTAFLCQLAASQAQVQWTQVESGVNVELHDIRGTPSNVLFAVGYEGTCLRSQDLGQNWVPLEVPTNGGLFAVHFINETDGFVGGEGGLFRTTDQGDTWTSVTLPVSNTIEDIQFLDASTGFCVGDMGLILKTTDGGLTWAQTTSPSDRKLVCVQFPTPSVGYITARGYNWEILKTTDGGTTWAVLPIQPITNTSSLEAVYFTDENTGYLGGWYISAFAKTTDGAQSWSEMSGCIDLYSIHFTSKETGYGVGWHNDACHTKDGGNTWQSMDIPLSDPSILYKVHFIDPQSGFIVGAGGIILRTENGTTDVSDEPSGSLSVSVAPNPGKGLVRFLSHSAPLEEIILFDMAGRIVHRELSIGQHQSTLNIGHLGAGIFAYRLLGADGSLSFGTLAVVK